MLLGAGASVQVYAGDVVRARAGDRGCFPWTSLEVQCLRLRASSASTAGGTGSIPPQGTKIPHAKHDMVKNQIINKAKTSQRREKRRYRRTGRHGQMSRSQEVANWSWGWEQVGQYWDRGGQDIKRHRASPASQRVRVFSTL